MARSEQLIRQLKLLQILERFRYGRSLGELRDELVESLGLGKLHPRSVRRDLQALQAAGFDLDVHDSPRGRVWKLGPTFRGSHALTASVPELIALSLARDVLYPLSGTPFWQSLETFWNKVRECLPEPVWRHYEKVRRTVTVWGMPHKTYAAQRGILKTLHRAIQEHRVVEVDYQGLGQPQPRARRIHPHGIVFYGGSLYAVVRSEPSEKGAQTDAWRHLKLDRFHHAQALDEWFTPDETFSLDQHLSGSLGIFATGQSQTYRVWVSQFAAPWLREDPWHPQQQLTAQEDGSLVVAVQAAHDMEILPRVLALGADAQLLEPESARQRLRAILQQMSAAYV